MSSIVLFLALGFFTPQRVVEIEIAGNRRVPDETILSHLADLKGDSVQPERLQEVLQSMWSTGLFDDIQFRKEEIAPGRIRLVVEVVERPVLRDICLEGDRPPRAPGGEEVVSRLREAEPALRRGRPVSELNARRAATTLSQMLEGRYEVDARLETVEEGTVDLVLSLAKRNLPRIEAIDFEGNRALSDEELRDAMELDTSDGMSWLTRDDRYIPDLLEEDRERLRRLYREKGFYAVEVGFPEVEPVEDRGVRIVVPIREGERYTLGSVDLFPGFAMTEEQARASFPLDPGDVYDAIAVERFAESLEERYRDQGHAVARVELFEQVDPPQSRVDVSVEAMPGPPFRVRTIEFRGHTRTTDRQVRSYLALQEGDRFSSSGIRASVRRLQATGYFRSVQPEVEVQPPTATVDLTIHVEEMPRFDYFLGGGVNGVEGAAANGVLRARDLLGRAETWSFSGDLGFRLQNGLVGYLEPFTLAKRLSWGVAMERRVIEYPDETTDEFLALSGAISGPTGGRWQFGAGLRFAQFDLSSDLEGFVPFLTPFVDESFRTHRFQLNLGFEGRDRQVFPTDGGRLFVDSELVGGFLGGDLDFGRAEARVSRYLPLGEEQRHLFRVAGRVEAVWPFGATEEQGLPRSERLFLGSENDLRGFEIRSIGPRDDEGVVVGGDRLVYGSVEYHYAATEGFRLVGFFDVGNVYSSDPIGPELPALRYDLGAELQLAVPVVGVPIRAGYAVNLDRLANEDRGRFFFTLAARF